MTHLLCNTDSVLLFHLGQVNKALFKRANRYLSRNGYSIRVEQIPLILTAYCREGCSQQELAQETGRDKASVQRTVSFLVKQGIMRSEQDTADQRRRMIKLTDEGKRLADSIMGQIVRIDKILFSAIGEKEKKVLICMLEKMACRLKEG